MRTRGWGGSTPASDEEAIKRILDAADDVLEARSGDIRVADVARKLGVARQTIYNYFPGPNSLIEAVANRSGIRFTQQLADHLIGITDPVDAVVESLAYTVEWLPSDLAVQSMLAHDLGKASTELTTDMAKKFGLGILAGMDVDWAQRGFDHRALDDLAELQLRMLQSFLVNPGHPPLKGARLRSTLRRWVGSYIKYELEARAPARRRGRA